VGAAVTAATTGAAAVGMAATAVTGTAAAMADREAAVRGAAAAGTVEDASIDMDVERVRGKKGQKLAALLLVITPFGDFLAALHRWIFCGGS